MKNDGKAADFSGMTDAALARGMAEEAGALLLRLREGKALRGRSLGLAGDRVANAFLMTALGARRPDDAVLCEECVDSPARLQARRVWVVDPLDGTAEYSEGRDDWAVHVALVIDGVPAVGAVAVPARGQLLDSFSPPAPPVRSGKPVMVVSRSRRPQAADALARHLGAEINGMGSAGAKTAAVIAGEADIYFHTGGQREWDNCAPAAVALAAGLHATRVDGAPLLYNRAEVWVPDLIIARPDLGAEAVRFLAGR